EPARLIAESRTVVPALDLPWSRSVYRLRVDHAAPFHSFKETARGRSVSDLCPSGRRSDHCADMKVFSAGHHLRGPTAPPSHFPHLSGRSKWWPSELCQTIGDNKAPYWGMLFRNGDKARSGRLRKQKIARRVRSRELKKKL